jgi:hypothetical protein
MVPMLVALAVALVAACVVLSFFSGDDDFPADQGETRLQDLLDP